MEHLFTLEFIKNKTNIIFVGPCGMGKTHLATALAYHACCQAAHVYFRSAVQIINALALARNTGQLHNEMKKYTSPDILVIDELGYLPVDKFGADLLFQVISSRYEQGPILLTTNRIFKDWPIIFNNDATLTSAVLDRLLHYSETIIIEGDSYRMRDRAN